MMLLFFTKKCLRFLDHTCWCTFFKIYLDLIEWMLKKYVHFVQMLASGQQPPPPCRRHRDLQSIKQDFFKK